MTLKSYACGNWFEAETDLVAVASAVDGRTVASVSSSGLDIAAMTRYARAVGGKKLRALMFAQRVAMLHHVATYLSERKDALYEASYDTGATRGDHALDIDGGIATLFAYASRGRRELPSTHVVLDGPLESLAEGGTFAGRHVYSPRLGIAVFINAYSFPCRGFLEKFAPAFIAGVPVIVKPATPTAYVAARVIEYILESRIVPEGALQSIIGLPGDLFEHLTGQDTVAFTGSLETSLKILAHPAVVRRGVRVIAERDSLGAAVLGPDAGPESPEFALFVRDVVREMTAKAGQNCTAIRRAIVPLAYADDIVKSLSTALSAVVVGDPRDAKTTMGPLVSPAQCNAVRARVLELLRSDATVAYGNPTAVPEGKAYMAPILLFCNNPLAATVVHEVEAFGPVATLLPYDTLEDAIELVNRAEGSLVASIYTYDSAVADALFAGIAPFHGRVAAIDRDCANDSTGHAAPLPALVHGGPGRAGGGEQLGGMRAVYRYMQRTALQGSPQRIAAYVAEWSKGAREIASPEHPFRSTFDDLTIGQTLHTAARTITVEDIDTFAHFTGDTFYAHMDDEAAKANPFFPGRVAHGYLVLSFAAGLFVDASPGPVLANTGLDDLRFIRPVSPGDAISVRLTVKNKTPRKPTYGEVRWDVEIFNQHAEPVASYELLTMNAMASASKAKRDRAELLQPNVR